MQGSHEVDKANHSLNTITEMIYVPDSVKDGNYILNLQIAAVYCRCITFETNNI